MSDIEKNVFVSHIHADDKDVGKLKDDLKAKGYGIRDYSVTKDNPNNANNDDYIKQKILKPRLDASSVLAVIISPETKDSEWVKWEVEYAIEKGKPIVGIWAPDSQGCKVPEFLDDYQDSLVSWDPEKIIDVLNNEKCWQEADGNSTASRSQNAAIC